MGRPKKASRELVTVADANDAMHNLLIASVDLEIQAGTLDLERAAVTRKWEPKIDHAKGKIADLEAQLRAFYHLNCPPNRKSIELSEGIIGTRLGGSALKPLNRSWTWDAIGIKLRSVFGGKYFHEVEAPKIDKEKVKDELDEAALKSCGLKTEQEEFFYADPDRSKLGVGQ